MGLYAQFDCSMPRDPRMIAAGPLGRLVYFEAALYCRENLTDGIIDRLILPFFGVDVPSKIKHLNRLAELGALQIIDVGWRIPVDVWRKWNPLKSEVEEHRQAEAERKAKYRADKKSTTSPNGTRPDVPTGQPVAAWDTRKQPKPEPKPEPKQESLSSAPKLTVVPTTTRERDQTINLIVNARQHKRTTPPDNERAWRIAVARDIETTDGQLIQRMLADGTPPEQVALFILGHGQTTTRERTANPIPWCTTDCTECSGDAWIDTGHGLAPCPNRAMTHHQPPRNNHDH